MYTHVFYADVTMGSLRVVLETVGKFAPAYVAGVPAKGA